MVCGSSVGDMSFKIDISGVEQLGKGVEDLDRDQFFELLDEWCEGVESTARKYCDDPPGKRIKFYRAADMTVEGEGPDRASIDCIIQAMGKHRYSMDTSLVGVYEVVLKNLERKRKKMLCAHKS